MAPLSAKRGDTHAGSPVETVAGRHAHYPRSIRGSLKNCLSGTINGAPITLGVKGNHDTLLNATPEPLTLAADSTSDLLSRESFV